MELIALLTVVIVGLAMVVSFARPLDADIQSTCSFVVDLMIYALLLLLIFK